MLLREGNFKYVTPNIRVLFQLIIDKRITNAIAGTYNCRSHEISLITNDISIFVRCLTMEKFAQI